MTKTEIIKELRTLGLNIMSYYGKDCCILTARAVIEVLNHFHIDCYEVPVTAILFNDKLTELIRQHGVPTLEMLKVWQKKYDNLFSVIIGAQDKESEIGKWNGHLIVIANSTTLVDPSIISANRPEKNIFVPPLIYNLGRKKLKKLRVGHDLTLLYKTNLVAYNKIDNTGYKDAKDWNIDLSSEKIKVMCDDFISMIERKK